MAQQRKLNTTYTIVMVIGLAFMLLFGYVVKPFSTVTETGVKMLGGILTPYYGVSIKCIT